VRTWVELWWWWLLGVWALREVGVWERLVVFEFEQVEAALVEVWEEAEPEAVLV
jgi:hypothetical protein